MSTKQKPKANSKPTTVQTSDSSPASTNTPKFQLKSTQHTLDTLPKNSYLVHATNCFGTWGAGVALAIHDLYPNADEVYAAHCDSFRPKPDAWPKREGLIGGVCVVPPQVGDGSQQGKGEVEGVWVSCLFTSYGYGRPSKKHAGIDRKGDIRAQTRKALVNFRKIVDRIEAGQYIVEEVDESKVLKIAKSGGVIGEMANKEVVGGKRKRNLDDMDDKDGRDVRATGDDAQNTRIMKEAKKGKKMDIYSPQFNSGKFGIPWEETKKVVEDVFSDWDGDWFVLSPPG